MLPTRAADRIWSAALAGCEPRNFLRPCLLLLLKERSDHGYDLVERLRPLGVNGEGSPGGVYRALRELERLGLVVSVWLTSGTGPARRTYRLTTEGERSLDGWARELVGSRRSLDTYLDRYAKATGRGSAPAVSAERRRVANG